jgi:mono/diheme cytochrome c family protein
MKKFIILAFTILSGILYACSGGTSGNKQADNSSNNETATNATESNPSYDPHRGEGKFEHVELTPNLNPTMAAEGKKVYEVKCAACHKLTNEKLVGPGWAGVTKKHSPEWIMNFITNPDAMIDKDPELQAQLEICLVRMTNQNLSDEEARNVLEFMRQNDGVK